MSRRYADPISVDQLPPGGSAAWRSAISASISASASTSTHAAPRRFRWRWRTYTVTEVLSRWVEAGPWWREGAGAADTPGRPTERQVWRVEASADGCAGVFDLGSPMSGGQWWLLRVVD